MVYLQLRYILINFLLFQEEKLGAYGIRKQYIGCYADQQPRTLPYERLDDIAMTNDMCASHCCSDLKNATFMGTELRKECYCSKATNSDNFVKTESIECDMLCSGNSNEFCGGWLRLSLYSIECSPDKTVTSCPPTLINISTVIPEVTTKSTVTAYSPSTVRVDGLQIDNSIMTEEELTEILSVLRNTISIDKKETNLYKASKMSVYDQRKSSRNIGIVGIIVLVVPVIFILRKECYCSKATNSDNFVKTESIECDMLCSGNSNEFCGGWLRLSLYSIECSPDKTVTSCPPTLINISTVIPEVTTKSTVTAYSPSTVRVDGLQIDNSIMTEEELTEILSVLRNTISIDKKETNLYKASKMSVYDQRKSSRNIGIVGIIVLVVPVIFIVIMDVNRICQ